MADKQESALTQQSDCKWVRALDANGNSIRISKEDLAAVVGGLITRIPKLGNPLKEGYIKKASFSPENALKKIEISKANGVVLVVAYHNTKSEGPQLFFIHKTESSPYYFMSNIYGRLVTYESADENGLIVRTNSTYANMWIINLSDDATITISNA